MGWRSEVGSSVMKGINNNTPTAFTQKWRKNAVDARRKECRNTTATTPAVKQVPRFAPKTTAPDPMSVTNEEDCVIAAAMMPVPSVPWTRMCSATGASPMDMSEIAPMSARVATRIIAQRTPAPSGVNNTS